MNNPMPLDASQWPDYAHGFKATVWWGMLGLIVVEGMVFASLIVSFFYLQINHFHWPPAGTKPPDLLLPTISTILLIASTIPIYLADKALKRGDNAPLKVWPWASVLLAVVFLGIKTYEYSHIGFRWDTHSYGSIVWIIIGLHGTHVLAVILKTLVILTLAQKEYFTQERRLGVTVNGLYWYFVAIIWLPLYATIYLGSRIWNA